jgi:hypothetical protein
MLARSPKRVRRARARRRRPTATIPVLVLWLALLLTIWRLAGTGAADYAAGFVSGAIAWAALSTRAERWARRAGLSARATAARPVKRVPRPAHTPIHDSAEHQRDQRST